MFFDPFGWLVALPCIERPEHSISFVGKQTGFHSVFTLPALRRSSNRCDSYSTKFPWYIFSITHTYFHIETALQYLTFCRFVRSRSYSFRKNEKFVDICLNASTFYDCFNPKQMFQNKRKIRSLVSRQNCNVWQKKIQF